MKKLLRRALVPVVLAGAVITAAAPNAAALSFAPCDPNATTRICYDETGETNVKYGVPSASLGGVLVDLPSVDAYLDVYKLPFGTGSERVPCVTPVVNGVENDSCTRLGLIKVSRTPLIRVDQNVDGAVLDGLLTTLYVCEAELTATVAGVGVERQPILAACYTELPPIWTTR